MKNKKAKRYKVKIKKGDTVKVTVGKDKGKTGKVEKVFFRQAKVLVAGVNLYKKHLKPKAEGKPGGIIDIAKPLPIANIALVCPKCQQPTRVGFIFDKQKEKFRVCKKCQEQLT